MHHHLQPGERLRADRLRPPRAFHRPGFLSRPCHSRLAGESDTGDAPAIVRSWMLLPQTPGLGFPNIRGR
ncbi:MAG: hypothetical protein IPP03_20320 [Dechloromonas sp.]|nr:hypothetical protein [Candidatus Dechloromonas phosphoritropha]